jgi:hypothetical protein
VRFGTFAAGLIDTVSHPGVQPLDRLALGYLEGRAIPIKDEFGDLAQDSTTPLTGGSSR